MTKSTNASDFIPWLTNKAHYEKLWKFKLEQRFRCGNIL